MIVHMIGNAHIDPVWLWSWPSGVDEALATFRSAADRCDEYPEFIFTRGEAWLYEQVERLDPELFARIRALVSSGQWHITGGQYVQPDLNHSTVMGSRRQLLRGRSYFQSRFGVTPTVAYNVDTFGHPATMPDLLHEMDYIAYVFHRPDTSQLRLPAQAFRWRGTRDGEVMGFRVVPSYVTRKDDLYDSVMRSVDAADESLGHTMCFYGVGNHGGGPTRANIEYILENANVFQNVELLFSTPLAFFDAIANKVHELPLVKEELQRTFPGCYSVMHDIKQRQIQGEHELDQCQRIIAAWGGDVTERTAALARLDSAWDDLLFTEFHDILGGACVPSAWESVRAMQGRARITAEELVVERTRIWARRALPDREHQQVVVMNPDADRWEGFIETEPSLDFDPWGERWLARPDGTLVDCQLVQSEAAQHMSRILFPLRLETQSTEQVLIRTDPLPAFVSPVDTDLAVSPDTLSNGHMTVALRGDGIGRILIFGQDVLSDAGVSLHLRADNTDTWTSLVDRFSERVVAPLEPSRWVVEESGPLRAKVHMETRIGDSQIRWTLTLHRGDPRLQLDLEVLFCEQHRVLQMPIALAATPCQWVDGLPGGWIQRQPGPVEHIVQGWSKVALEVFTLALITNDMYSVSVADNVWQWTLLRSPKMAWGGTTPQVYGGRDWYTDQGPHAFRCVLHVARQIEEGELQREARQQAQPPIVFDRYDGLDRPPWGNNPPPGLR